MNKEIETMIINMRSSESLVVIGSGEGREVLMLHKLNPSVNIIAVDTYSGFTGEEESAIFHESIKGLSKIFIINCSNFLRGASMINDDSVSFIYVTKRISGSHLLSFILGAFWGKLHAFGSIGFDVLKEASVVKSFKYKMVTLNLLLHRNIEIDQELDTEYYDDLSQDSVFFSVKK